MVTLSPSSLRLLRSLKAFDHLDQRFVTTFHDMLVYEQAGSAYMRFNSKKPSEQSMLVRLQDSLLQLALSSDKLDQLEEAKISMGASIENLHLQAGLLEQMRKLGKTELIQQKVVAVTPTWSESERPVVTLADGTQIKPKLLVGSDGEKSLTRSEYKIGTSGHSYGQKGLVCTVSCL